MVSDYLLSFNSYREARYTLMYVALSQHTVTIFLYNFFVNTAISKKSR